MSVVSQTIPLASGLYIFGRLSSEMKILVAYFGVALMADLVGTYLAAQNINNLWVLHIMTIIEFGFLMWVFSCWQNNRMLRRILRMSIPLFSIVGIIAMFFLEGVGEYNTLSRSVECLILVAASAFALFELSKESFSSVFNQPRFWVGCAVLIYYASTLFFFSLSSALLEWSAERRAVVFDFHTFMNVIANLIYAGGFVCQFSAQKSGGPSSLERSPC